MTSVDYKVNKRLRKACKAELKASGCHQAGGMPIDTEAAHSVKLSFVLLCLEDHQKAGTSRAEDSETGRVRRSFQRWNYPLSDFVRESRYRAGIFKATHSQYWVYVTR